MSKCEWNNCTNDADKVVYRMSTDEEREKSSIFSERGGSFTTMLEISVCNDHLEEAQKEYPHIANKTP